MHSLFLELETLTSDSNGRIRDTEGFRYDFSLSDADVARIRKDGIDLNTYLPVKNPGDYYVGAAIKDRVSGKIGSGYQFLEIPDLSNRRLSLSSIFVLNNGEEASLIGPGKTEGANDSPSGMQSWRALRKSPAVRSYLPGESFGYVAFVHNAKTRESERAKLEFQSVLYKDGQIYQLERPEDASLNALDHTGEVSIRRKLDLGSDMDEGSYLLRVLVTDNQSSGKPRIAVQAIDSQIRKE